MQKNSCALFAARCCWLARCTRAAKMGPGVAGGELARRSHRVSLDGGVLTRMDAGNFGKAQGQPGHFTIGSKGDPKQKYLVDEVMFFNRPVEMDEVKGLWESKPQPSKKKQ